MSKFGYIVFSESWYAKHIRKREDFTDDIIIQKCSSDGGFTAEFLIEFTTVEFRDVVQLKAYDDSWDFLSERRDLLDCLTTLNNTTSGALSVTQVKNMLDNLGFENLTQTEERQEE